MDRKTFKSMSPLKKIEWIIQYYGVTIVVVLTALFIGGLFLKTVLGPGDGYEFRVLILDDECSKEAAQVFAEDLTALTGVSCEVVAHAQSDPNQMQAFAVRLFSDDVDMVITPEEQMLQLIQNGYMAEAPVLPEQAKYYEVRGIKADPAKGLFIGYGAQRTMNEHVPAVKEYFMTEKS